MHFFAKKNSQSGKKKTEIEKTIEEIKKTDPDADVDDKIKPTETKEKTDDLKNNVSEQIEKGKQSFFITYFSNEFFIFI